MLPEHIVKEERTLSCRYKASPTFEGALPDEHPDNPPEDSPETRRMTLGKAENSDVGYSLYLNGNFPLYHLRFHCI